MGRIVLAAELQNTSEHKYARFWRREERNLENIKVVQQRVLQKRRGDEELDVSVQMKCEDKCACKCKGVGM